MRKPLQGKETIKRTAVRALILTPEPQVLLMQVREPVSGVEIWHTPGGGLDSDESAENGLHRELKEETGLQGAQLGPLIWTRHHLFQWNGKQIDQQEYYYLVETERFDPSIDGNPDAGETEWFLGFGRWTVEEVVKSERLFSPRRLGYFLEQLVRHGIPQAPIDIGR